jgi:hypothetical protein
LATLSSISKETDMWGVMGKERLMNIQLRTVLMGSMVAMLSAPVTADSDAVTIEALQREIKALQARVEALEGRHTSTSFMPNFAERFHVMRHAGEAGDWAVAAHELNEMKRLTALSTAADKEQGALMQAMMEPSLIRLEEAIEHGNQEKFDKALEQTIDACYRCHVATGSAFVVVTLNASDSLSFRHPHALTAREAPDGHHHGMPTQMEPMMQHMQPHMMDKAPHADGDGQE